MSESFDYLTYMKEQVKETYNATFMEFVNEYPNDNFDYFCFLEGADDEKYYQMRLNIYLNNREIRYYDSKGKKNVLELYKKLKKDKSYEELKLLFFIDKDYDFYLEKNSQPSLYVTPCYSIENLYSNLNVFERILSAEFHLGKGTQLFIEYKKTMERMLAEFNNQIIEFNSLGYTKSIEKISNDTLSLSDYETKHLLKIHDDKIVRHEKYEEKINEIYELIQMNKTTIRENMENLSNRNDFINDFRGKNQLDIFIKIIGVLQQKENTRIKKHNQKILEENRLKNESETKGVTLSSVNLNITKNRISELSHYADTPESLIEFLKEYA